jgi:hypothetical protein
MKCLQPQKRFVNWSSRQSRALILRYYTSGAPDFSMFDARSPIVVREYCRPTVKPRPLQGIRSCMARLASTGSCIAFGCRPRPGIGDSAVGTNIDILITHADAAAAPGTSRRRMRRPPRARGAGRSGVNPASPRQRNDIWREGRTRSVRTNLFGGPCGQTACR